MYTTLLREVALANNVNGSAWKSQGGSQNQAIGAAFETWVLAQINVLPAPPGRNTKSYISPARQFANMNNTPKPFYPQSVIPEFVGNQGQFLRSVFFEVKAVAGPLTLNYSQSQILGLLDVADISTAKPPPPGQHPVVYFITTGNTSVPQETIDQGVAWGVEVWQQQVLYDVNDATPTNPLLQLDTPNCLTVGPGPVNLCEGDPSRLQGPPSRLAPALPPVPVQGDDDPATIDG